MTNENSALVAVAAAAVGVVVALVVSSDQDAQSPVATVAEAARDTTNAVAETVSQSTDSSDAGMPGTQLLEGASSALASAVDDSQPVDEIVGTVTSGFGGNVEDVADSVASIDPSTVVETVAPQAGLAADATNAADDLANDVREQLGRPSSGSSSSSSTSSGSSSSSSTSSSQDAPGVSTSTEEQVSKSVTDSLEDAGAAPPEPPEPEPPDPPEPTNNPYDDPSTSAVEVRGGFSIAKEDI